MLKTSADPRSIERHPDVRDTPSWCCWMIPSVLWMPRRQCCYWTGAFICLHPELCSECFQASLVRGYYLDRSCSRRHVRLDCKESPQREREGERERERERASFPTPVKKKKNGHKNKQKKINNKNGRQG